MISLTEPATYLHAALRAFVSNAHQRVSVLLTQHFDSLFNYGEGTPYPNLTVLREKLREAEAFWRHRNAFIADLIQATATDSNLTERDIFLALTNYFFCYVKVDRHSKPNKPASTVRALFAVDVDCCECPLGPEPVEKCQYSCYRFAFFPFKPPEMLADRYMGHYKAAQFALADASFTAAAPDLSRGAEPEVWIAPLMVPLLLNRPIFFEDVVSEERSEECRFLVHTGSAVDRVLVTGRSFPELNHDLGVRCEAILPIQVERPFMPGFGRDLLLEYQGWVPGFPESRPFSIEFYSPMADWFARSWHEPKKSDAATSVYSTKNLLSNISERHSKTPIPRIFGAIHRNGEHEMPTAGWREIGKILALGFNLQHYSELMAISFIDWLREVLTRGAYDAFALTLEKEYRDYCSIAASEPLPPNIDDFLEFVRKTPRLLSDVLTSSEHGILLEPAVMPVTGDDLSSLEGIQHLAREVELLATVETLAFDQVPYCKAQPSGFSCRDILQKSDSATVLRRLVAEVLKNHKRPDQSGAIRFHVCVDPYQRRLSLHFCSLDVRFGLETYLSLRQGLPQRKQANRGGIGLAVSRVLAEEHGFGYVVGLGRHAECCADQIPLNVQDYRRDFHTRIYFGRPVDLGGLVNG